MPNNQADINKELFQAVESTLNKYGDLLVTTIQDTLIEGKHLASGTLVNSIHFQINHQDQIATLELSAEDYFKYVDQGRKPGSKAPPLFAIVKWLESRRLDVLGTDYARTGLKGRQTKRTINKAIAAVQRNHPQDVVRRAWIIAKSIGIKGISPLNALPKAAKLYNDRLFIQVNEVIADKLAEITARELEDSVKQTGNPNIKLL